MKRWIVVAALFAALFVFVGLQRDKIEDLKRDRNIYRNNTESLLSEVQTYKFRDSLNAARVLSLQLRIKDFERFRAEDAEIIKDLKQRNRDLSAVNKTQSETIIELRAIPRDTVVIVRDSILVPAVSVHCGDNWYKFDGLLTPDEFTGKIAHRDSLLLVESVRYKRFLCFKTKKVKDRQLDCISKSPYNTIVGLEYVIIER